MWRHLGAQTRDSGADALAGPTATGEPPSSGPAPLPPAWFDTTLEGQDAPDGVIRLHQGLDEFRLAHSDSVQPAGRVISPLLDLWGLAAAVDHAAAVPIERLLKALVARTTTTSGELSACADEVEAILKAFAFRSTPQRTLVAHAR